MSKGKDDFVKNKKSHNVQRATMMKQETDPQCTQRQRDNKVRNKEKSHSMQKGKKLSIRIRNRATKDNEIKKKKQNQCTQKQR